MTQFERNAEILGQTAQECCFLDRRAQGNETFNVVAEGTVRRSCDEGEESRTSTGAGEVKWGMKEIGRAHV